MSIITKRGDQGSTDLLFGKKAHKTSPRVEALGAVDELSAHLGLARVHTDNTEFSKWIDTVQKHLINLMGEVATEPEDYPKYLSKGYGTITPQEIEALENLSKHKASYPPYFFYLPNQLLSQFHIRGRRKNLPCSSYTEIS